MKKTKPAILLNTSPLRSGHVVRGIGFYTRHLEESLKDDASITLLQPGDAAKPDLVHYPFFDLFLPSLPIRPWVKTVVTIHDVIPLIFPEQYKPGIKGRVALKKQKVALTQVSAVITDSETSKQDIIRLLPVAANKLHVVPLAGQPEIQTVSKQIIQIHLKKLGITKPYCLYVGDINYNKNIPALIKMLKFLPETISLVCVGKAMQKNDIPEWRAIENQVALSNVSNRVHFISSIATTDVEALSALYSGALCYVQPSLYEGFGLPVIEALACETPVVSSNRGSLPEVLKKAAFFAEPTAEALAQTVLTVKDLSANQRKQQVAKGLTLAHSYTWKKTAENTIAVYKQVLNL